MAVTECPSWKRNQERKIGFNKLGKDHTRGKDEWVCGQETYGDCPDSLPGSPVEITTSNLSRVKKRPITILTSIGTLYLNRDTERNRLFCTCFYSTIKVHLRSPWTHDKRFEREGDGPWTVVRPSVEETGGSRTPLLSRSCSGIRGLLPVHCTSSLSRSN